jgi:hypothetical protein
MSNLRCINCSELFERIPQVPNQVYCCKVACQKERRREWQKQKRKVDQDYKDNQYRAQRAWADRNPDYWRNHRENARNSTEASDLEKNKSNEVHKKKVPQHPGNKLRKPTWNGIEEGVFVLKVLDKPKHKMDVWIIELTKFDDS